MNDDPRILVGDYPFISLKERGGKIITKVIPDVTMKTFRGVVLDTVKKVTVSTDELQSYSLLAGNATGTG